MKIRRLRLYPPHLSEEHRVTREAIIKARRRHQPTAHLYARLEHLTTAMLRRELRHKEAA